MQNSRCNTVVLLKSVDNIIFEDRECTQPGPNQVLLEIDSVGICGSDVHYWKNGFIGDFVVKEPMVLGHESAGVVVALGNNVSHLAIGDRVAVEPGVGCRCCDFCKSGRYNLCPDMQFLATPPVDGSLARYHVHAADYCFKLPDHVSLEEGALLEPLSVGVHACRRAGVTLGSRALVCGAGPIGLVNVLTARAMGAEKIVVTDINSHRLQVAKEIGADSIVCVTPEVTSESVIAEFNGHAPDVVIECTGAEPSIRLASFTCKSGGVVVLVGLGKPEISFPIVQASVREVDIRGVFRYVNCYPTALSLISQGRVNVKPLITHRFPFKKSLEAFETARTASGNAIKVIIKVKE